MVELASDFLDRSTPIFRDDVCFFISQSGNPCYVYILKTGGGGGRATILVEGDQERIQAVGVKEMWKGKGGKGIPKVAGTIADYVLPLKRRRTEGWKPGRIGGCKGYRRYGD